MFDSEAQQLHGRLHLPDPGLGQNYTSMWRSEPASFDMHGRYTIVPPLGTVRVRTEAIFAD